MNPKKTDPAGNAMNMTLAAVAGQVGCVTVLIIIAALVAGIWLDNTFGTRPLFIIGLLLGSVPVTLILMFWMVRKTTARMQSPNSSEDTQEVSDIGK